LGIFTTHFLKDIELYCDKLALINDGQLLCCDYIDHLKKVINGYNLTINYND